MSIVGRLSVVACRMPSGCRLSVVAEPGGDLLGGKAVLRFQFAYDLPLSGMDIFADGNIPPAAGLSSSSSIVVAVAEA